jgi:hemolysin III
MIPISRPPAAAIRATFIVSLLQRVTCKTTDTGIGVQNSASREAPADYYRPVHTSYRLGDILANSITHGVGAALAIAGAAYMVTVSTRGSAWLIVSCAVFATTLVLVYICSTLYHSLVRTRARHVFQVLDHSSIYLLIAGTYTPFTLVSMRGPVGWTLFVAVWALAVAGIIVKSLAVERFAVASAVVYLFQGWLVVFAWKPLIHAVSMYGILWLLAGGLAYTLGVVFFAFDRLPYFHAAWHVFVLAGSLAHYFAVLLYVVPSRG